MSLEFNLTYNSNVPAAVETVVNAVAAFYESTFTNNVTINIDVGWGELGDTGTAVSSGAIGENEQYYATGFTYSQIKSALTSTGANATAIASLPTSNPAPTDNYAVTTAEAKALGLMGASSAVDDQLGFNSSVSYTYNSSNGQTSTPGTYDLFSVAAHEITEAMGRTMLEGYNFGSGASYDPMDLYQYSAPGTRLFTQAAQPNYFSLNGGVTDLVNLNSVVGADAGDWAGNTADSFNAFGSTSGVAEPVTAADIEVMEALGWKATAANPVTVTGSNFSVGAGKSVAISSDITVSNPNSDSIGYYGFYAGSGGGYFTVNGVAQANGQWFDVSAANLSIVDFVGATSAGSQTLYTEVYDATLGSWSNYSTFTATTGTPTPATVTGSNFSVGAGKSVAISSDITLSNPASDSIGYYGFYAGSGSGHFTVNGTSEPDGQWIYVSAANLSTVDYVGGSTAGSQTLYTDVYDATVGTWSAYTSFTATTTAPVVASVTAGSFSVGAGKSFAISSDITVSNPNSDSIGYYGFYAGGGGTGYFTVNGTAEPTGQWIDVSASNLSTVDYIGGSTAGSQTLYTDVYDATVGTWSAYTSFTATTTAPVVASVTAGSFSVGAGKSFAISSDITVSNPNSDSIGYYGFYAGGGGTGYFTVNGTAEPTGQWIDVSASNLSTVDYIGGSTAGSQTLYTDVYDATVGTWSAYTSFTATTTAPVVASVTAGSFSVGAGKSDAISSDITLSNPNSDSIGYYGFYAGGGGTGYFTVNGTAEPTGQWIDVSASNLSTVDYVGGPAAGSQTLYLDVYDATAGTWSAYSSFTATTTAPVVASITAANFSVGADESFAISSDLTLSNPNGDSVAYYGFYALGSGGYFTVNGTAEPTGQWIDVSAANLSTVDYIGGSTAGSQTLYVDVYDATVGTWSADTSFTATTTAPSLLNSLQDAGIKADVGELMTDSSTGYSLSYTSMLTILDDAAAGGMNASKFSTLQTLASMLNATGGISTSTYVQDITNSLIDGDPANQYWTGGASTSVALGNLSAASTQTQVDELIGKWFLGTDLPSMNVSAIGDPNYNPQYEADTASLFGSSGIPSYLDVNQGNVGDCYFVATLAEVALQDPTAIESMITTNSNGTYGVRFFVNGVAEYVTVDDDLPDMTGGYQWANKSTLEFANGASGTPMWAELVEKAFAQLNAEPDAVHGGTLNSASNSYEGIDSGYPGAALEEITGQTSTSYAPGQLVSDASVIGSAFASGEEVEVDTPAGNDNGNLVADHSLEVIGYNASTETFTLHNPWGSGYSGPLQMTFTETASALAADNCWMVVAQGTGSVGTGTSTITGGDVLGVDTPASGNLAFVASIGTLQLDNPSSFSGTVAGLSGQDAPDLWKIDPAIGHTSYWAANFGTHSA